jgi:hypothetical protein
MFRRALSMCLINFVFVSLKWRNMYRSFLDTKVQYNAKTLWSHLKIFFYYYFMTFKHRNHSWSLVVIRSHSWSLVVIRGHSCSLVVTRGHSWSLVVTRGHSWSLVVTRGHSWSSVVTRGHSWSLVCTFRQDAVWPDLVILITFGNISRFFWLFW